ncbi:RIP metalloprotease RseP [Paracraurococcus lichenis]|uniref:Zinc metalloprotease n=1 Tax=Paracraurococcus lichenis TaxID=3064888 RepID=A0ABT9DVL5_9PROT|nr:RIP metalloprotease RseP [Paracraurococcus sp. LOR1-02]MDO9707946.1 RIP metalloprotease RseP [Paracraurococcus sp. LOR1-02]
MELLGNLFDRLLAVPGYVLPFVVGLGLLVFIHELGHYLAARWRGVHAEVFSIGFGRPLLRWTDRRGTEWRIAWIPLGGFVKMHGQETPEEAPPEVRATWQPGRTFHGKSVGSRAIVVAAGPIANFLLAIVLFAVLFTAYGRPVPDAGQATVIARVAPDSAAAQAGLRRGDRILSIDGQPITSFEEVQRRVQPRANERVDLLVERDGASIEVPAVPRAEPDGKGRLGVTGGGIRLERLDPATALVAGIEQTAGITWHTLVGVGEMITGQRSAKELGGPIRIAEVSAEAAQMGLDTFINLLAVLSVSLGLLNLFPIPVLDGGHLMFYAAEAIRGRPLPPKVQEYGFRAGFALLIALFLFASRNDIVEGGIGRFVAGLLG